MPTQLSPNAQVIKYFAQRYASEQGHPGIPRTRLVKLVYLSDLLAREYLGRPLTSLEYIRYRHGPWDRAILDAIAELVEGGFAHQKQVWDFDNVTKLLIDLGQPVVFDFSPSELEILRYVAKNYMGMPLEELLYDVVYQTPPMKAEEIRFSQPLPMDMVDNSGRRTVGFDLDAVLAAEQEIEAGRFSTSFVAEANAASSAVS